MSCAECGNAVEKEAREIVEEISAEKEKVIPLL
jgi:hypothetical protein